ncbi:MAG: DUF1015 family protein [Fimbriimonas ginsengisoli]|nr:DUF1015 family protein [Fimbriimonas ginsengisoli]
MAEIRPFQGLRFTPSAGPLDHLVAPPYDVLSEDDRDGYGARSPHNVVHLTLPEQRPDDRSKYIKYARSAAALAEWRREGLLAPDPPSLYRYTQTFEVEHLGGPFTRTSLIALIKAEPYEKGVVLPHEQTFPKHKEDRLRLLEATRAHLECIFGLYEDAAGTVLGALFLYFILELLIYAGVSPYFQEVITGAIIIGVIGLDCALHRKRKLLEELA